MRKLSYIIFILAIAISCHNCGEEINDVVYEAHLDASENYVETQRGVKIISNGYNYDIGLVDLYLYEIEDCMVKYGTPIANLYVEIVTDGRAFPCEFYSAGCGGLYTVGDRHSVIYITSNFGRLRHEYIHHLLYYYFESPDSNHESEYYEICGV